MNDAITRLKRNIAYSYVSGDPVRDRVNCANGVLECEPVLSTQMVDSFSPREMEQLAKVLCQSLHSDDIPLTRLARICLTLLLALVRTRDSSFYAAIAQLKGWMVLNEPDSILRAHLERRLLNMPYAYTINVLSDALARAR